MLVKGSRKILLIKYKTSETIYKGGRVAEVKEQTQLKCEVEPEWTIVKISSLGTGPPNCNL